MLNSVARSTMERLQVDDAQIEYEVRGEGEPVLLIQLSVVADGLAYPLFAQPELASRYQLIHYHRRGYAGSTRGSVPLSAERQAADATALVRHLGIKRAHVAGHSYGGLIALQLALDAPDLVHSLAVLEAPLPLGPGGKVSRGPVFEPMMNAYRAGDKRKAVELFSSAVFGPDWQTALEQAVPGSVEQAVRDMDTFIQEGAAFQEWQFGPRQAAAVTQPVLSVLGSLNKSPVMKEGRLLLHSWFPQTEDLDVPTTHLLQMQDPKGVAHGLAEFFARHPMG